MTTSPPPPSPGASAPHSSGEGRERARPLSPEIRRDAILNAVVPLVRERGRDLSTREIADAAGVAEGTIFRAFGDKESLIAAAIERIFDPLPLHAALQAIDRELTLEEKLAEILTHLRERFAGMFGAMAALRLQGRPPIPPGSRYELPEIVRDVLADDLDRLAAPADVVAHYLRLLAFSSTLPDLNAGYRFADEELAEIAIHGLMRAGRVRETDDGAPSSHHERAEC